MVIRQICIFPNYEIYSNFNKFTIITIYLFAELVKLKHEPWPFGNARGNSSETGDMRALKLWQSFTAPTLCSNFQGKLAWSGVMLWAFCRGSAPWVLSQCAIFIIAYKCTYFIKYIISKQPGYVSIPDFININVNVRCALYDEFVKKLIPHTSERSIFAFQFDNVLRSINITVTAANLLW